MSKQNISHSISIGDKIKELRQKKGFTQKKLSDLLSCGQTTVAEWERSNDRIPSKKFLAQLAEVLGISLDYLVGKGKIEAPNIPCYGEFPSEEFIWPETKEARYYIEVPQNMYHPNRFSLKITDDLLEPVVCKDDYCIFEKLTPNDGDIVLVRFPENHDKAIVRKWRQQNKAIMLLEANPHKVCPPYYFEEIQAMKGKDFVYLIKGEGAIKKIVVEAKLVAVKKIAKIINSYPGITYIFS